MVRVEQIQRGVARYIDEEFTNKLSGWQKWVFGASAAMFLENFSATTQQLQTNPVVKTLGVFDESGNIDVEKLYRYFKKQAERGPTSFSAPILGTVTMNAQDIDKLYTHIMQA